MSRKSPSNVLVAVVAVIVGVIISAFIFNFGKVETITPTVAPQLIEAKECGAEPTVKVPEEKGIKYTTVRSEDVVVVTAQPDSRKYEIEGNFQWVLNVSPKDCSTRSSGIQDDSYNYADELIEDTKRLSEEASRLGQEANQWAEEEGIWDKFKDMGNGAKESVEDWAQTR